MMPPSLRRETVIPKKPEKPNGPFTGNDVDEEWCDYYLELSDWYSDRLDEAMKWLAHHGGCDAEALALDEKGSITIHDPLGIIGDAKSVRYSKGVLPCTCGLNAWQQELEEKEQ
jgi:hypothetical protein